MICPARLPVVLGAFALALLTPAKAPPARLVLRWRMVSTGEPLPEAGERSMREPTFHEGTRVRVVARGEIRSVVGRTVQALVDRGGAATTVRLTPSLAPGGGYRLAYDAYVSAVGAHWVMARGESRLRANEWLRVRLAAPSGPFWGLQLVVQVVPVVGG